MKCFDYECDNEIDSEVHKKLCPDCYCTWMSGMVAHKFEPEYDPLRFRLDENGIKEFHMMTPEEMKEEKQNDKTI